MALSGTIQWEIRSGGVDTNGGGYKSGGTDYTQQTSPQTSGTVGTSTASTTFTDAGATFTSAMVGNVLHLNSATGGTAGFYEITGFTNSTTITLDAASGTYTNGAWAIGGALATLGKIGSATANQGAVAGNTVWMKGSFTLTANDTFSCAGSSTSPIRVVGYSTTRGDGYSSPSRTNSNGLLVTSKFATLAYNSTFLLNVASGSWMILECLNITGNRSGGVLSCTNTTKIKSCRVVNASTNTLAAGISLGEPIDCDVLLTGATGGATGYGINATSALSIIGNHISTGTTTAPAILLSGSNAFMPVIDNVIYTCGGVGISVAGTTTRLLAYGNTITGCASDGINITTGSTVLHTIVNNCITENLWGINMVAVSNAALLANNYFRDNTSGTITSGTDWVAATSYNNVVNALHTSDYTTPGSDFSLTSASPAVNVGLPSYRSIGALQRSQLSAGGGSENSFVFIG